ncbi:helix-turn-helix domain-containing protein [Flammeovirga sp. OC4]|uniref:AraC family transcriptional regulator n=1 Tax=Flammeovirga sp. OC4 TaxID=1382345 RepID=UPI0005C68341|nr:helix-turn-helix domain-containing protein [Flammeovirga sp. OC4]
MKEEIKKYDFRKNEDGLEFEIVDLQKIFKEKNHLITTSHRARFYHILWIEKGHGTHYVDFKPIKVEDNTLIFVAQNSVNLYDANGYYEGKSIIFTNDFFCQTKYDFRYITTSILYSDLYDVAKLSPIINREALELIFHQMNQEAEKKKDQAQKEILHKLLYLFLLQSERAYREQGVQELEPSLYLTNVINFKEHLEESYKKEKGVKWYANSLNLSEKQLNKSTAEVLSKSPKKIIDERVVLEAKRLLVHTDEPVKEIAYELGYDEPTNFIKFFKRHATVTPADFRVKNK